MSTLSASQLTLDFQPGLVARHARLLDCVKECIHRNRNPLKTVAADMDLSQSELSRRMSSNPNDHRAFSLDDLEQYVATQHDVTPILYLVEKYLQNDSDRQKQALHALAQLLPDIAALVKQAKGNG